MEALGSFPNPPYIVNFLGYKVYYCHYLLAAACDNSPGKILTYADLSCHLYKEAYFNPNLICIRVLILVTECLISIKYGHKRFQVQVASG